MAPRDNANDVRAAENIFAIRLWLSIYSIVLTNPVTKEKNAAINNIDDVDSQILIYFLSDFSSFGMPNPNGTTHGLKAALW